MKKWIIRLTALIMALCICIGIVPALAVEDNNSIDEEGVYMPDEAGEAMIPSEIMGDVPDITETEQAFLSMEDAEGSTTEQELIDPQELIPEELIPEEFIPEEPQQEETTSYIVQFESEPGQVGEETAVPEIQETPVEEVVPVEVSEDNEVPEDIAAEGSNVPEEPSGGESDIPESVSSTEENIDIPEDVIVPEENINDATSESEPVLDDGIIIINDPVQAEEIPVQENEMVQETQEETESSTEPETEIATEEVEIENYETFVDSGTCGDNLTWTFSEDGTLTISGTGAMYDYEFEFEAGTLNAPYGEYINSIKTIVIQNGVTGIGADAFAGCYYVTSVSLPDSLINIGSGVFRFCHNLTKITIPNGVTEIGVSAFKYCEKLGSINIPNNVKRIESDAFYGCRSLQEIVIPESVIYIGTCIAGNCDKLTSIKINSNNQYYDSRNNCNAIIETNSNVLIMGCSNTLIPQNVSMISTRAFYDVKNLIRIVIPESVTNIAYDAFWGCKNLKEIVFRGDAPFIDGATYVIDTPFDSFTTATAYYPDGNPTWTSDVMQSYGGNITWIAINIYTVTYNANGGTGAPSSQTKMENVALTLSSTKPTKKYKITYHTNGGSVSTASKNVNCTFKNWNTKQNGSGTSYTSGGSYTANAAATLYAQWTNPTAGTLATPTRSGYTFGGWYTATTGGTKVTSSSTITGNITIYAHWIMTGWQKISGKWYYYNQTGEKQTGFVQHNGKYYYFSTVTGELLTGWVISGGKYYYMDPATGALKTGAVYYNGKYYYFSIMTGELLTGWVTYGGKYYYFSKTTGALLTGWVQDGSNYYYFSPSTGELHTGWLQYTGYWFYLNPATGALVRNTWMTIGGKTYTFNVYGVCIG